jgi:hypothetical protein
MAKCAVSSGLVWTSTAEFPPLVDVGVMSSSVSVYLSIIDRDTTRKPTMFCNKATKDRRVAVYSSSTGSVSCERRLSPIINSLATEPGRQLNCIRRPRAVATQVSKDGSIRVPWLPDTSLRRLLL